ncbi:MAG: hypothetical protein HC824_16725 [Synechococcales cyanobacterium RM1_1_8]|nr:hypothetical protein [Synechococcales cyanobacterium RM1_1_8]
MTIKKQLQDQLKQQYGINKNISNSLSPQDCTALLTLLERETSVATLVSAFADKNADLGKNNRYHGQKRSQAERQLEATTAQLEQTQAECDQLQTAVAAAEERLAALRRKSGRLGKEEAALEAQIQDLEVRNQSLKSRLQGLEAKTQDLTQANDVLKRDNKALKNLVDQIRLRLALDVKKLMRYEDSEIRRAAARLFNWTQG